MKEYFAKEFESIEPSHMDMADSDRFLNSVDYSVLDYVELRMKIPYLTNRNTLTLE